MRNGVPSTSALLVKAVPVEQQKREELIGDAGMAIRAMARQYLKERETIG